MRSLRPIAVLFALLALAAPARGQATPQLQQGDWLRVESQAGDRTSGKLVGLDDQRLQIRDRHIVTTFPLTQVRRLEVGRGRRTSDGVLIGGAIGLAGGIVLGALKSSFDPTGPGADLSVIGVPLVTAPAGMLLGGLLAPRRYHEVARP